MVFNINDNFTVKCINNFHFIYNSNNNSMKIWFNFRILFFSCFRKRENSIQNTKIKMNLFFRLNFIFFNYLYIFLNSFKICAVSWLKYVEFWWNWIWSQLFFLITIMKQLKESPKNIITLVIKILVWMIAEMYGDDNSPLYYHQSIVVNFLNVEDEDNFFFSSFYCLLMFFYFFLGTDFISEY